MLDRTSSAASIFEGGDWSSLIRERGTQKVPRKIALANALDYASGGAALGATRPDVLRAMFERTYAPVPKEQWQQAYAAGLDIGPEQPRTTYAEAEDTENKNFMEYCREFRLGRKQKFHRTRKRTARW